MLCSTNTTVRLLATSRASSTVRSTSSRPMPLVGSSSSSTRGSWVSEILISRFRFWPWERSAARTCSLPFSRTCPAILRARGSNSRSASRGYQNRTGWPVRACRATTRFSRTVSVSNTLLIWKERDSPRSTILCGGSPAMVSPNSSTVPSLGCRNPDRQLNSVVFPAPLGPRMAWISPSSTERSTRSSARKPRNDRETARACNATGMGRTPYNPSHIPARYGASRQGGLDASFGEGGAGDRGGERYRPRHRAGLRARGRPGLRGGRERGGRRCARELGGVDVMVSNAGVQHIAPLTEFAYADWRRVVAIHLDGGFLLTRACLREMVKQKRGGSLIYMGSVHSKEASPLKAAYVAAKHGLLGLCRSAAKEGAQHGVRANSICPGFVRTPLVEKQIPEQARELGISEERVIKEVMLKNTVDGEFSTTADVAEVAVFLASFPTNALTGQSLNITHGWHMD